MTDDPRIPIIGKTITDVYRESVRPAPMVGMGGPHMRRHRDWRPEARPYEAPTGALTPSGGDDIVIVLDDGSRAVLRCCSCCDGLAIDVKEPE